MQTKWNITDNRFITFLDILGFKNLVASKSHEELYEILKYVVNWNDFIKELDITAEYKPSDLEITTFTFSDTIIIITKNDSTAHFDFLSNATGYLIAKLIENSIPVKGAISHGVITVDKAKQIYVGQPIIDSYQLEEDINYIGVVAHNSLIKYLSITKEDQFLRYAKSFYHYVNTPLKSGDCLMYNLDWYRHVLYKYSESKTNDLFSDYVIKLIQLIHGSTSNSALKYINNTVDVIESIKKVERNSFRMFGG